MQPTPLHDRDDCDKPKDECGVFGVFGHPNAAHIAYVGLRALQHRGQESAGIVAADGAKFTVHKDMGLVNQIFTPEILSRLDGRHALGHNRYSTAGQSDLQNAQPLLVHYELGPLSIAHNGQFANPAKIRKELLSHGQIFTTSSDTEIAAHLIAKSRAQYFEERIIDALKELDGAYSLLCLGKDIMAAVRDPYGFRPLWKGTLDGATLFASETCALDAVEAEAVREVLPGEIVVATDSGEGSTILPHSKKTAHCVFELLYLSRPDSVVFSESVALRRQDFGRQLAKEAPVNADIVVGMPESANAARPRVRPRIGHPVRIRRRKKPVRRQNLHPAEADAARILRRYQNQPDRRGNPRQEGRPHRRLAPKRHHAAQKRTENTAGGRQRGTRPNRRAADAAPVLLRRGHPHPGRTDCQQQLHRTGPRTHPSRLPRIPQRGRHAQLPRQTRRILLRMLRRSVSHQAARGEPTQLGPFCKNATGPETR